MVGLRRLGAAQKMTAVESALPAGKQARRRLNFLGPLSVSRLGPVKFLGRFLKGEATSF